MPGFDTLRFGRSIRQKPNTLTESAPTHAHTSATAAALNPIAESNFVTYDEPYKTSTVSLGLNSFQVTDGTNTITVNGLKSAGSVYDEIKDGKYIKRVYTRAYQSGDESDATVITDGTNTNAPLETPIEYDLVSEIPNSYPVYEGGTEEILSDAVVATFVAEIRYPN